MVRFLHLSAALLFTAACERAAPRPATQASEGAEPAVVGVASPQSDADTGRREPLHTISVADAPPGLPPRFSRPPGACTGEMHTSFDYVREPRFLDERERFRADSLVTRRSETLRIRTNQGLDLIFRDCRADSGDMYVQYVYYGRGPGARGHVLERRFYEGGDWLWIDDSTGVEESLASAPHFAPDSAHFAVANVDLHGSYTPNVFEVWEVRGSRIVRVVDVALGEQSGARDPVWISSREVRASRVELDSNSDEAVRGTLRASHTRGRWVVDDVRP